ncbi:MAG: type IV pilus secretin PilQ [Nitrospiraceae bacterium]
MKSRRISPIMVLSILLLQGALSCMYRPTLSFADSVEAKPLDRVGVTDLGNRLRIEVDGGQSLSYSLSTGVAPASVTVELPGLARGTRLETLDINTPPVLQMVPREIVKPRTGVQLVFLLTTSVKPDVHTEGTRLVIDFPKEQTAGEQKSATRQDEAGAQSEKALESPTEEATSQRSSPAKMMTKVEVQKRTGEATVVVFGDGDFIYDAKRLSKDRLVIDLPNVASMLASPVLPVDHALLKQIRIGQHAKKIRLVFDLSNAVGYSIKSGQNQLAVRLTAAAIPAPTMSAPSRLQAQNIWPEAADKAQPMVRVAAPGRVPFPERLSMIHAKPALAQMAPEIKGSTTESEEIGQPRYVGRRISMDFQAADISNVLRLIAEVSGFNIVVGEGVKSKVTLKLVGVPWDQALDMLLKMNNLGMIRESNIVWIDTLANIARQQDEEAKAKESKIKAEELVTKVLYVQNVSAQEIQTTLRQYLSPRGLLNVNAASNALVLQDTESRIASMAELVRSLDLEVPQVQIEARIVQADTSYARSLGVQWGIANTTSALNGAGTSFVGNQTGSFSEQQLDSKGTITRGFNVNLPAAVAGLTSIPAAGFTFGKIGSRDGFTLDIRLSAGELLGLTKVIAAPKITTLDKREAKISQGESIPFQTTSLQGTQTTFVDANLELQVTPQITSRDPREVGKQVLLKIRATRNAVGARSNPAGPSIDKREATTQVLVRDGETMVIGGIFVDSQTNQVGGIPYLSRIPVLGWLFKNKTETIAKQELLIFLTPSIVKG